MADRDRAFVGVPTALVAVLLAGTFLRPSSEPPQPKATSAPPTEVAATIENDSSSLKQLRPVMQLLGQALGTNVDPAAQVAAANAALADWDGKIPTDRALLPDPSAVLKTWPGPCAGNAAGDRAAGARSARAETLKELARVGARAGELRADAVPKAYAPKALLADLEDCADQLAMADLVDASRRPFNVDFLVAIVPDYVDSSSGWRADQVIGAIQGAMADSQFALDRFRLIDWVRTERQINNEVITGSRLHELQPGALIFRREHKGQVFLRVVLLVLETPTGGVHRRSLRNAIQFLKQWNELAGEHSELRIIGPGFSGSVLSLALELRDVPADEGATRGAFSAISVVATATADENQLVVKRYAPHVRYTATTRPSSLTLGVMRRVLGNLNPEWRKGRRVAFLTESNTAFGTSERATLGGQDDCELEYWKCSRENTSVPGIEPAWVPELSFKFPLHISQLMSDMQTQAAPPVSLMPTSAVPLTLRESAPPADQIPALRPQLTSPIVENEVNGILDKIHHERMTAVGIVATDERDVLFLARLLKRQAPNVQLFLTANNLLYLHSEYLPYMRGTLVASTYPLYLPLQTQFHCLSQFSGNFFFCGSQPVPAKRSFQSMVAEAVYNATQIQIGTRALVDYCAPSSTGSTCVPPVWVSIIGDDGFWPVDWQSMPPGPMAHFETTSTPMPVTVLPLPAPTWLLALLLLGVIGVHAGIVMFVWARLPAPGSLRQFQDSAFVRVLAPPITHFASARRHALALLFGFAVLAALTMWVSGLLWMHAAIVFGWPRAVAVACTIACGVAVFTPAILVHWRSKQFPADDLLPTRHAASHRDSSKPAPDGRVDGSPPNRLDTVLTLSVMSSLLVATLFLFGAFLLTAFVPPSHVSPEKKELWLALEIDRFASGGMVSPAWLILFVFAAIYTVCFAALRRISLLGSGYASLAAESETFRLLAGEPIRRSRRTQRAEAEAADLPLVRMLDMPAQSLPWLYPAAMIGLLLMTLVTLQRPHTVEGRAFSAFLICASAFVVSSAFFQLAQAVEIWRKLRPGLTALAHSRLEPALSSVAGVVRWNLSLVSPHLRDLEPLASLADRLYGRLVALAARTRRDRRSTDREKSSSDTVAYTELLDGFLRGSNLEGLVRPDDLSSISSVTRPKQLAALRDEMTQQQYAPLLQSRTWFRLWDTSDRLVGILEKLHWHRHDPVGERGKGENKYGHDEPEPEEAGAIRQETVQMARQAVLAGTSAVNFGPQGTSGVVDMPLTVVVLQQDRRKKPGEKRERVRQLASWLSDAETLVALQCALVLRDILSRVMSCLFTSMLCLTLLSAGHLLYLFQGRSALLTVDLVAVTLAASVSIWLLVAMERDTVLSRLRHTTPGRVDINWEFLKRIGIYGVLPLIAVLGSLFPEIQEPLLGWLDPLRKLVNF
jgi:hypothetical protein